VAKKPKGVRILKNLISYLKNTKKLALVVGMSSLLLVGCVGSLTGGSDCPIFPWPPETVVNKLESEANVNAEFSVWLAEITAHGEKIEVCRGEEE
jgi:hypothetical protein|tara:strand:+ start:1239 stop:1523 length:285 start_codon:yes stop_codon:yes gene_type:complete